MQIDLDKLEMKQKKQIAKILGININETKQDESKTPGSIRKRGKDTYQLRYRGQWTTVTAKDDYHAEKALAKFIALVDSGKFKPPSKMNVKQLSERFLRDNPDLTEETRINYRGHIENRILDAFGELKIDQVKPTHFYDFYDNLKEDGVRKDGKPGGLSPATIQKYHHILSSMFAYAVDNLHELDENPCASVKPPKIPKRKPVSLEKDPAIKVLRALADEALKWKVITLIAACTGMRRGECLGIEDTTIDLQNCVIKIENASRHRPGAEIRMKDPKSDKSIRAIPFPSSIVPLIEELIAYRDEKREKLEDKWVDKVLKDGEWVDNHLLFIQWNGKPMHPNSVDEWWKKFREANNLPQNLTFHGLRHTNITMLLKAGVDIGTVADNAGHAKKSTTLDYDDPSAEALREVATKMNDILELKDTVAELVGKPVNKGRKKGWKRGYKKKSCPQNCPSPDDK